MRSTPSRAVTSQGRLAAAAAKLLQSCPTLCDPTEAALCGNKHSEHERQSDAGWKASHSDRQAVCSVLFTSFSPEPRARLEQDGQANTGRTDGLTFAKTAVDSVCVCTRVCVHMSACVHECVCARVRVCTSACVPACTRVHVLVRKVFSMPGFFKEKITLVLSLMAQLVKNPPAMQETLV